MTFKENLHKLQNQSESQKKMIVWSVTILLGIALLAWWIPRMSERMKIRQGSDIREQLQLQELQEQLHDIPIKIKTNGEQ